VRLLIRPGTFERARRVAAGLQDAEQRTVAVALTHLVSGRPRLGEKILWEALARNSASSAEAFAALLILKRRELAEGKVPEALGQWIDNDPQAAAVVEGWRRARLADPSAIRRLEPQLASLDTRHPLFDAANALRILWRQASGDATAARQGLDLLEPALAHGANAPGLLRRAQLAVLAGDQAVAAASLEELAQILEKNPRARSEMQQGLAILDTFPAAWRDDRHRRLAARLSALLG
jgi:hypothetical protein